MSDSDLSLIRTRRAEIAKLRAELDAEDADLNITEKTLARLQAKSQTGDTVTRARRRIIRRIGQFGISQKEMLIGTLRAEPSPWVRDVRALQERIKEIHGAEIPMTSIYPYLTELKNAGIILRGKSGEIALAERVKAQKEAAE